MKKINIWVIPTDKPSNLFIIDKSKMFLSQPPYLSFSKIGGRVHKIENSELYQPQNIYITSDEKFIRDEYITDGIEIIKATLKLVNSQSLVNRRNWKKIILTIDQDLIADGIEQISEDTLLKIVEHINSGKNIESFDEL